jgi:hypothetical protein
MAQPQQPQQQQHQKVKVIPFHQQQEYHGFAGVKASALSSLIRLLSYPSEGLVAIASH